MKGRLTKYLVIYPGEGQTQYKKPFPLIKKIDLVVSPMKYLLI